MIEEWKSLPLELALKPKAAKSAHKENSNAKVTGKIA